MAKEYPITRKFGGKVYQLKYANEYYSTASLLASYARKLGGFARVTETEWGYSVWIREAK